MQFRATQLMKIRSWSEAQGFFVGRTALARRVAGHVEADLERLLHPLLAARIGRAVDEPHIVVARLQADGVLGEVDEVAVLDRDVVRGGGRFVGVDEAIEVDAVPGFVDVEVANPQPDVPALAGHDAELVAGRLQVGKLTVADLVGQIQQRRTFFGVAGVPGADEPGQPAAGVLAGQSLGFVERAAGPDGERDADIDAAAHAARLPRLQGVPRGLQCAGRVARQGIGPIRARAAAGPLGRHVEVALGSWQGHGHGRRPA